MKFGQFENFESFLDSYAAAKNETFVKEIGKQSRDAQIDFARKAIDRDIVEVKASVKQHLPDGKGNGAIHYHLLIEVASIVTTDKDIQKDLDRCIKSKEAVFVAIRFGDRMGISEPIKSGIEKGNKIDIKGEWITKEKAYSHGGEKMSVLHFTHKPVGFICTGKKCYQ